LPGSVAALAGKARASMHQAKGRVRIVLQRLDLRAVAQGTRIIAGESTLRSTCL